MSVIDPSRERRLLWLLALTQFTVITDFMVMMPLGPQLMAAFRITPTAFAVAVSAYSWCAGLSGLLAAFYIDRFDRRRLLLTVYALFALSNLGCAAATGYPLLLAARAFAGLTGGVLSAIVLAIIGDAIPAPRRGAATGTVMTAFALAAVGGVPLGVVLGARCGWAAPFALLGVLSAAIWCGCRRVVPRLDAHLTQRRPTPATGVLPDLWRLFRCPPHLRAFVFSFLTMASNMLVIPFIAPVLVANYGVRPAQLSWIYMAGGAATLCTSHAIGRLADRIGQQRAFRLVTLLAMLPVLFITHLPNLPFVGVVLFAPVFMTLTSGRMVPMQALLTTVPEPARRGAFLSMNSALQSLGSGCGAWLGGVLLSAGPHGRIDGYGANGWVAVALMAFCLLWVGRVGQIDADAREAAPALERTPLGEA